MMEKIKELKIEAYDVLAQIQYLQKQLVEINNQIGQLSMNLKQGEINNERILKESMSISKSNLENNEL